MKLHVERIEAYESESIVSSGGELIATTFTVTCTVEVRGTKRMGEAVHHVESLLMGETQ